MKNIPLSKNIAGIVTNQNVNDVYALFNKNNKKISTICNLENIDNQQISNVDLITLQLNEGVIYMGQIEDDDAIDKYKYCLLYTSPSPRDRSISRMPSSA